MKKGFTLIELMMVIAITGILSTIAIPNFLHFRSKAMQAEAKANLGALHTCQTIYFSDYGTYAGGSDAFNDLRFIPVAGKTRYTYILDQSVLLGTVSIPTLPPGVPSSTISFTALAVCNIDNDDFIDFWVVNQDREIKNQMVDSKGNWTGDGSDLRN